MSFSYNPFKHIEIIYVNQVYSLLCDSCGAEMRLPPGATVVSAFAVAEEHVRKGHARTPEHMARWSVY